MYSNVCIAVLLISSFCQGADVEQNPSSECSKPNMYKEVTGKCESYIACKDSVSTVEECPDGLYFSPQRAWPAFPCDYPEKVDCVPLGAP